MLDYNHTGGGIFKIFCHQKLGIIKWQVKVQISINLVTYATFVVVSQNLSPSRIFVFCWQGLPMQPPSAELLRAWLTCFFEYYACQTGQSALACTL